MKKIITLSICLCIIGFTANAQNSKSALNYLNFVSKEQKKITKSMWNYTKAIAHSKSDRNIRNKRKVLLKTVDKAILKIKKSKGFKGDKFKNEVIAHLTLNKNILNNDYGKVIDMKEVAEQSYDLMEAYFLARKLADKKLEESQTTYEKNYYTFATENNIKIIENETDLSKKMKIANTVFDYYDEMYLLFFKVQVQESNLWGAIKANDINTIQQNTNSLNTLAKEGLEKLTTIKPYKKDNSLLKITEKIFQNYIDVSENKIAKITDFLILNEDFNKLKKVVELNHQNSLFLSKHIPED